LFRVVHQITPGQHQPACFIVLLSQALTIQFTMSLLGSIFGTSQPKDDIVGVFEQSAALPERPRHEPLPPKRKARKEHTDPAKKKRKRKEEEPTEEEAAAVADAEPAGNHNEDDPTADSRTIFVGNLPLSTTRNMLASLFRSCGKVASTRLRSVAVEGVKVPASQAGNQALVKKVSANTNKVDTTVKSTAQGYVVFQSEESLPAALALNNKLVDGLRMRVDKAEPTVDSSRSVFVGGLPYATDEATLRQHFCKGCGLQEDDIDNVRIIRDKDTMQCKGFGYIVFTDKSAVMTALQKMHDSTYMKKNIRVTVCGKRFKGRRGVAKEESNAQKRKFEGDRADAAGALRRVLTKETLDKKVTRKRGASKAPAGKPGVAKGKPGMTKRQVLDAKVDKRVKKLEKRAVKGMGKTKKN
jgi:RNA recognition motif-containing protein